MSNEETKQEPEAWEVIAGEWPPLVKGNRPHSPLEAWGWWEEAAGITRRAYAESIAPRLVREAAALAFPNSEVQMLMQCDGWREFIVRRKQLGPVILIKSGPDICAAALAAIRALEGGGARRDALSAVTCS